MSTTRPAFFTGCIGLLAINAVITATHYLLVYLNIIPIQGALIRVAEFSVADTLPCDDHSLSHRSLRVMALQNVGVDRRHDCQRRLFARYGQPADPGSHDLAVWRNDSLRGLLYRLFVHLDCISLAAQEPFHIMSPLRVIPSCITL